MTEDNKTYKDVVFGKDDPNKEALVNNRQIKALNRAWEIRSFEISLYWKRALYFWGFIIIAFNGYFSVIDDTSKNAETYALLIACAGLVFSVAWFLVNKGSKFWQENWEYHIDCLEDDIEGRLHKVVLVDEERKHPTHPSKAYPFSVSKINAWVSFFVIWVWVALIFLNPLYENIDFSNLIRLFLDPKVIFPVISITIIAIFFTCKTSFTNKNPKKFNRSDYQYWDRGGNNPK